MVTFANLASIGSFASGLGSFASGLGIGGNKGPGAREIRNHTINALTDQAKINNYDALAYRAEFARDHGLHKLAVLGVPPGNASAHFQAGGNDRTLDLAQMGQGVDRALNAGRAGIQRKLDDLALEKAQLSNDYIRAQIANSQAAAAKTASTIPVGNRGLDGASSDRLPLQPSDLVDIVKDRQITKNPNDTGRTAGNHSGFMELDLGGGVTAEVPITDGGSWAEAIGELPFFYKYPKMAEIMGKRTGYKIRPYIKKFKKWWNK